MSGWALAKYVLALAGVLIVILADKYSAPFFGWVGLGLVLAAFLLRFWQRVRAHSRNGSGPQA
jgi:hypothetical protein